MSNHKHIYIGPYVRIKPAQVEVIVKANPRCCNKTQTMEAKFCSSCGGPLEPRQLPEMRDAVSRGDVAQEIDEALCCLHDVAGEGEDGFHYWYPNGTPREWSLPDPDKSGAQELTDRIIKNAVLAFRTRYQKEIETLVRAYNATADYQFGVLVWWL